MGNEMGMNIEHITENSVIFVLEPVLLKAHPELITTILAAQHSDTQFDKDFTDNSQFEDRARPLVGFYPGPKRYHLKLPVLGRVLVGDTKLQDFTYRQGLHGQLRQYLGPELNTTFNRFHHFEDL